MITLLVCLGALLIGSVVVGTAGVLAMLSPVFLIVLIFPVIDFLLIRAIIGSFKNKKKNKE